MNSQTAGADVHVPFGGVKGSGWGRTSKGALRSSSTRDTVTVYQDALLG